MDDKIIKYHVRDVFGRETWIPNDPTIREIIVLFNGQKSITDQTKKAFDLLGYTFEQVIRPTE